MKHMTATQALIRYWAELIWNIASLFWQTDCICQLRLPATNTVYLVGFRGRRRL